MTTEPTATTEQDRQDQIRLEQELQDHRNRQALTEREHGLKPAFPCTRYYSAAGGVDIQEHLQGISIRDYFAAKAMAAIAVKMVESKGDDYGCAYPSIASVAYFMADAMLQERASRDGI